MPPFFVPCLHHQRSRQQLMLLICAPKPPYFLHTHALIWLELAFFIKSKTCALFWGHFPLSRAQVQVQLEAANVRVPHVRISEYMYTYVCAVAVRMYVYVRSDYLTLCWLIFHISATRPCQLTTWPHVCAILVYTCVCVCVMYLSVYVLCPHFTVLSPN